MKRAFARTFRRRSPHHPGRPSSAFRRFLFLSLCSMAVFVTLGIAGHIQRAAVPSSLSAMKGLASSLSGSLFRSLLAMELPRMGPDAEGAPPEAGRMAFFLVRFLTDLNPAKPQSLLAGEMPGMDDQPALPARTDAESGGASRDIGLPQSAQGIGGGQSRFFYPPDDPTPEELEEMEEAPETPPDVAGPPLPEDPARHKTVFIYHSHNRESFLPELGPGAKDPNHSEINVTLVGKRLARSLEEKGIGAVSSSKDYASAVKSYDWNLSYQYSRQTVRQAMAGYENLEYFFDIHRDSQRRSKTTVTIDGKDYAQVYFIIGRKNPNWKQNEAFARKIHEKLEERYPGLSRGIWGKSGSSGHGEYNQSLAPGSVLIEIGGIENTLEECYRTADILADVIAEIIWESRDATETGGPALAEIRPERGGA